MRLKHGAIVNGVQPEITVAMMVTEGVCRAHGIMMVVTSLSGGAEWRSSRSLHPAGLAFDLRIWEFEDTEEATREELLAIFVADLQSALGDEFDVVLEDDHIHVEFDPER